MNTADIKKNEREQIAEQTALFLAMGGQIQIIPQGLSGFNHKAFRIQIPKETGANSKHIGVMKP